MKILENSFLHQILILKIMIVGFIFNFEYMQKKQVNMLANKTGPI